MSIKDAKQKFSELREDITVTDFSSQEKATKDMVDLLKKYPALCADALDMIEKDYGIFEENKKELLDNIIEIKPELGIDIIRRFNQFDIYDDEYIMSKIADILQKQPNLAEKIIENTKEWEDYQRELALHIVVKDHPELFQKACKITFSKTALITTVLNGKDKLSEKDITSLMGEFSYKNICKVFSQNLYDIDVQKMITSFIEKVAKGNPDNKEILKKCLLMMYNFKSDENTDRIRNEIFTLQPELKDFADRLDILKLRIPVLTKLKKIKDNHKSSFKYTTGRSDLTQLKYMMKVKRDKKRQRTKQRDPEIAEEYKEFVAKITTFSHRQINKQQEQVVAGVMELDKDLNKNVDLNEIIGRFNSLAKQIKGRNYDATIAQKLKEQRDKIGSKIKQAHQSYGKQIQQILSSPEKISEVLNEIDFKDDTSSVLAPTIVEIAERTKSEDVLKILVHKKEEAYGTWDYDYSHIRGLEEIFAQKNYIQKTLNKKYPNLSLEEQLIQAAYDVVNSGDEQKKKEFNEFILAEGEPRLAELDAKVMDYLHDNCTQTNLDKVNALRSFYGLKVELATGNTVDADERTAVRKVFDRTWSSYERGKNIKSRVPYPNEASMKDDRELAAAQNRDDPVQSNPYYENAVSPAYRKYFEEHDIYEIYQKNKYNKENKKYSAQNYFDSLIDKSPFKALRKHGLYNDMKIICDTLEVLQVEPEIATQFNLKDLSDMVVNSHNTLEDRKVYNHENYKYMFTKSPHTDELDGNWREPYYWHQYDYDDDEYDDEYDTYDYNDIDENDNGTSYEENQYDEEGFKIIPVTEDYSEREEEVAARDAYWEDLADHNPKAVKYISEAMARHDIQEDAIKGFWKAAGYGTPGVGSRRDWRLLSATLHHAEAIQYGGNDDKNNFVGTTRYYDSYGDIFEEDDLHIDYHKSFHRRDTPFDALYINPNAKSADDKLATVEKSDENSQKAFLITSFTDPHMHFYAGFRKKDQYTDPLYHMRNIEKEKQERVNRVEKSLEYLTKLGNALVSISICVEEALKTEEKINTSKEKVDQKIKDINNNHNSKSVRQTKISVKNMKNSKDNLVK